MAKGIYKRIKPAWNKGKTGIYSGQTIENNRQKHTGKKASEDTKTKMRKARLGKKFTPHSDASKAKRSGKNHWNWKGGIQKDTDVIRHSIEMRLWREAVFARDNYTCQKSGEKGGKLVAHHINNFADYPELRFAIDNGITLSEKSHKEFHKKYGRLNNTGGQLLEFLTAQK